MIIFGPYDFAATECVQTENKTGRAWAMLVVGLVKPKTYDWKDSNLALFGSDVEREVKSSYSV